MYTFSVDFILILTYKRIYFNYVVFSTHKSCSIIFIESTDTEFNEQQSHQNRMKKYIKRTKWKKNKERSIGFVAVQVESAALR